MCVEGRGGGQQTNFKSKADPGQSLEESMVHASCIRNIRI